ncbi:MAG: sugar ABC transporter ATP-binding protein [Ilumatobacteraceae bacterium]
MPGSPFLRVEGLSKQYGGIQALADVTFDVPAGTIHALVGANGAGKSTLVRVLAGLERTDEGTIYINGRPTTIATPQAATRLGLSFIHQELNLVPKFTVLQNMALNFEEHRRLGIVNWGRVGERASAVLAQLGEDIPLDREVDRLTVSERWTVSLGRSLMRRARLIAMDEPTASFAAEEAERLFSIVRDLAAQGVAVLYISHRLDEVIDLSDRITVLRNGRLVDTFDARSTNRRALTEAIVGRDVARTVRHQVSSQSEGTILRIEDLVRKPRVQGVTLDIRQGEILGVAGLVGAGRTELARLIFGADAPTSGTMTLSGRPYAPKGPYEAIARGVALVPEERRSQGLLLKESLSFNVSLATIRRNRWRERLPLLSTVKARDAAREMVKRFAIKARSVDEGVSSLSGGNQQKVVVSKYVRAEPTLLILDEPTVGVDVGARAELYEIIRRRADAGTAVLMISSDFEELEICDRVVVMREGCVVAIVDGAHATKENLTSLCYEMEATEP